MNERPTWELELNEPKTLFSSRSLAFPNKTALKKENCVVTGLQSNCYCLPGLSEGEGGGG